MRIRKTQAVSNRFFHTLVRMKNVLFVLNAVFKVTPNTEAAGPRGLAALQRNGAAGHGLSMNSCVWQGGDSGTMFG